MNNNLSRCLKEIAALAGKDPISIMEVCGTHTMAARRSGIPAMLPDNLRLISGPGCPVCVTPDRDLYRYCLLSRDRDIIITTFGDLLRVPVSGTTLERERERGADIRVVYSPMDSLTLARDNPGKRVVFIGVGFETTAPAVAATVIMAREERLKNFHLLSSLKTMPRAMKALLEAPGIKIDGYLCPGHVSAIIGSRPYRFIPEIYHRPAVITGFEPEDILQGLLLILKQLREKDCRVEIQYRRAVKPVGNPAARRVMETVFQPVDDEWRGLGVIPGSGLKLRAPFRDFDGWRSCVSPDITNKLPAKNPDCLCGRVITGSLQPEECPQFQKGCTPENPLGPCMVSSEGSCAASYRYRQATSG